MFWGLIILKSQHPMYQNLTWNETWNYTCLKKMGGNLSKSEKLDILDGEFLYLREKSVISNMYHYYLLTSDYDFEFLTIFLF